MNLTTKRLLLRPLSLTDLKTVHEYASDIENTTYMLWLPNDTEEETEAFLRDVDTEWKQPHPSFYEFAIVLDGLQIGAVSICLDETGTQGEIGWILNKKHWNKGYVTEAAEAIVDFARNDLKLEKIIAQCDWRNTPSAKVMEKLGMTLVDSNGQRTYAKRDETARELTYILELTE